MAFHDDLDLEPLCKYMKAAAEFQLRQRRGTITLLLWRQLTTFLARLPLQLDSMDFLDKF